MSAETVQTRISALIAELIEIQSKHGDLIVCDCDDRLLTLEFAVHPKVYEAKVVHGHEAFPGETHFVNL